VKEKKTRSTKRSWTSWKQSSEEKVQNILHQEDGVLFRKLKLWVPMGLRAEICGSENDMKVAGHMGQDKTRELIRQNFWWPGMNEEIIKYI
jgi:hypothetical protein